MEKPKRRKWRVVFETSVPMDAQMMANKLDSLDIETVIESQVNGALGAILPGLARVFVDADEYERALAIIEGHADSEDASQDDLNDWEGDHE